MQIPLYGHRLLLCKKPVDFRKAVNGLTQIIVDTLEKKPTEDIYIFYNKNHDKLKILSWHKNGFVIFYKRFEKAKVKVMLKKLAGCYVMREDEFKWLLAGLEWQAMKTWDDLDYDEFY